MKLISLVLGSGPRLALQRDSNGPGQIMKRKVQSKEKRRAPRRVSLMPAVIFYPHQNQHVACKVLDLSQDGALIEAPLAGELPRVFWLRLDGETKLRFCLVIWGSENRLGVEFTEQIIDRRRIERWGEPAAVYSKQHVPG